MLLTQIILCAKISLKITEGNHVMNEDISREALLVYLEDLRTLETIIQISTSKILEIENEQVKQGRLSSLLIAPQMPHEYSESEYQKELADAKNVKKFNLLDFAGLAMIVCGLHLIIYLGIFNYAPHNIPTGIIFLLVGLGMFFIDFSSKKFNYNTIVAKLQQKKKDNENALAEYHTAYAEFTKKKNDTEKSARETINTLSETRNEIDKEIIELRKDLQQAYSANIIPLQFRSIEGIYYLYDYISTSNQGLSEALMQANLEAIKTRLDGIIKMHGAMIVEQAKANAVLGGIYEQNRQLLETAKQTAVNSKVAAQYAQISATNSALAVKMQAEQLAYQKADFYLTHI